MKYTYAPKAAFITQLDLPTSYANGIESRTNGDAAFRKNRVKKISSDTISIHSSIKEIIKKIVEDTSMFFANRIEFKKVANFSLPSKSIYINTVEDKVNLVTMVTLSPSKKRNHKIVNIKFYIIDDNYTLTNDHVNDLILKPNSFIYQVSNENVFNVFEIDKKYYTMKTAGAKPVKVSIITGQYISHEFGKIDVIDNSKQLKEKEFIKINYNATKIGTNLKSDDGEYISTNEKNIAAGEYQTLDEKKNIQNINVDYIDLSKLNKSLSGKIMTIEMLGKKYYQVI